VFAAIAAVVCSDTSSRSNVKVPAEAAVLVTATLVITAVVADGTVYSVVLVVAAAVRARALVVVAIIYYLSLPSAHDCHGL
jgi:hypothetical protein